MTLDLEAIKKRHLSPEQMEHRTFYEGHIVIDLAACVEEIEHLRSERRLDNEDLARAYDMGRAEGEKQASEAHLKAMRQIGALLDLPVGVTDLSIVTNALIALKSMHRVLRGRVGDP